jgi:putative transport protein
MLVTLTEFLRDQPVLVFFLVLSLGYLVGNIRVAGISLGSVGGVLLVGLVFGHLGFSMQAGAQTFGFAIFIFCVGYQAGPQFFDVLLSDGLKYLSLALVVAASGFVLAAGLGRFMGLEPGLAAGLLGGALTTTPTLAAAQDAVKSGIASVPDGYSAGEVIANIGAAYALTYLFGLIGLILVIRLLPRLLGIDLPAEAARLDGGEDPEAAPDISGFSRRTYRVTREEYLDRSIEDIERAVSKAITVTAIQRDGELIEFSHETRPQLGDEIQVIGRTGVLLEHAPKWGEEISAQQNLNLPMETVRVVVSNTELVGKSMRSIRLEQHVSVVLLQIRRQREELPLSGELELRRGDVVTVMGPEFAIERLARHVGHVERDVAETDLFTFALGIAVGIAIGTLTITVGGLSIGIGMAGGLLITGLVIGLLRSIWPVFGRVPSAARWVLMELGLLIFMAGVGLNSGGAIVEVVQQAGAKLIGAGILVTLVPVLLGYAFSVRILKLNPVEALGGVTGAMTSGAALSVVTDAAQSNAPALGYTGAYAFANVILTLAGTAIMLI